MAWFPLVIAALVLFAVACISKCVARESLLISNFILLMGGLELVLYFVLLAQGFAWGSTAIGMLALLALIALITVDLIWWLLCYRRKLPVD